MKKLLTVLAIFLVCATASFAQLTYIAGNNPTGFAPTDTNAAYYADQGVRSVYVADDMDGDGKQEVLATDYSNGGRIHVFELNGGVLELVFSTPVLEENTSNGSTPRWVRSGDIDGDGNLEIIFPLTINGADGEVQVWEYNGNDNGYGTDGTAPTYTFPADNFVTSLGIGSFRTNREVGEVLDFDGDGRDELIMANRDNNVYILGLPEGGQIPGFGGFDIEGGAPSEVPSSQNFHAGSYWHSVLGDFNGDGDEEILNHYWNYWGIFGIEVNGTDDYTYPDTNDAGNYYEYLRDQDYDGVGYMGVYKADVDGNGKDELIGLTGYSAGIPYKVVLLSLDEGTNVLTGLDGSNQFGVISEGLWPLAGNEGGSHWGINAADIDQDGNDEIIVGGSAGYNVGMLKYKGDGSLLDPASYDESIIFEGAEQQFFFVSVYDSAGVLDTNMSESPFVSKIYAGSDLNNNGDLEVVTSYQSVADSIEWTFYTWDDTEQTYMKDTTYKVMSDKAVNIRVLEWTGTSLEETKYAVVTPEDYVLEQNYPNPFNPTTSIRFSLPVDKKITVKVFDVLGNEVKTLVNNVEMTKGSHEVIWDGTNNQNSSVASGTYIYTLQFGNFVKTQKMTLLK